ncbi:putative regulator of septum formation [Krasilnikovia cinnamomea]|uniref:Putative regulator of septum formation n=1 Tax=Krasilnikovia cinnamomea TaxID=349313 RepID=A0A4Q7ZG04_9ACTN|nr:septum formation family protein [Krasilnikovia cinnamomea]RZU48939.1 putative regulator of septum formation [Krasilnikovia cinnamomea]
MRRWFAVAAVAVVLAAAGCTAGSGTDRDLTGSWSMIGPAVPFRPASGVCHEHLPADGSLETYRPVPCAELHLTETFAIRTAPDAPVPPTPGSAQGREAYEQCARRADAFLGGPWREARIGVRVFWPSRAGWRGGARWYRCDVTETDADGLADRSRSGSLAGALRGASPLRLGCFEPRVSGETVRAMAAVPCTKPHRAEFVGLWTAPEVSYAALNADRTDSARGCRSAIARYTGVPDDNEVQYRTGWISYQPSRAEWQYGERRVRCFLWFRDRKLTRSMRDAGPTALPVR